jgi:cytidylate kinase
MVSEALGLRFINFTFRSLAEERGIDLKTVLELAAKDDSWDREVDTRQVKIAREEGGCVLGSRLAIWMLEEADLKVYLHASEEVRAGRIEKREGGCIKEITAFTAERDKQDHGRYFRIYNIDTDNYNFVDLEIDTDGVMPEQIVELIVKRAQEIN